MDLPGKCHEENNSLKIESVKKRYNEVESAMENSFDGVMITSNKGIGMRVNPALLRLTGLGENHFVGKNIESLTKEGFFAYEPITIRALREKRIVTGVQEINTGRAVTVTGVPVMNNNKKIIRVITNVRDLAELIRLKEDMQRSQELLLRYQSELAALRFEMAKSQHLIAQSDDMLNVLETAFYVANADASILILGESGVGKDVIARFIHVNSSREGRGGFIKVNCSAIPRELMESEFFGYEKGSFTGARHDGKRGYFELADGGTLFLDEIADLPLELQGKLLRVLEEKEIFRIGAERSIKVDVRILAATNKDIEEMVAAKHFRRDLFYRLNVVPITVPPLRERKEDISALLSHFLAQFNEKYKVCKSFSHDVTQLLLNYAWPGNVRELKNLVERMVITTRETVIQLEHLPQAMFAKAKGCPPAAMLFMENEFLREQLRSKNMKAILDEVERKIILLALNEHKSSRKVGEILGISHSSVINKLRKYNLIR